MNPIEQIGRYKLPLLNVVAVKERDTSGWRKLLFWRKPGFDVLLNSGQSIDFTYEEKARYDELIEWHGITLLWYGAARGMGMRG